MNIYLIPYTSLRHVVMALLLGGAALLSWWTTLWLVVVALPWLHDGVGWVWTQSFEGALYLGGLSTTVAFATVFAEGSLRRRALRWRFFWAAFGAAIALAGTLLAQLAVRWVLPVFTPDDIDELLADASVVTLRFRLMAWVSAGAWAGLGPWVARRMHAGLTRRWTWGGRDAAGPPPAPGWVEWALIAFAHLGGGLAAGAFGAAAWHVPGFYHELGGDLYLASAAGAFVFGATHGMLVWPIPDDLYAGWVRVLSAERYGLRIPIPHGDGTPAERFVGHFPRGLDLYLPADRGVAELHASFVMDADRRYTVRGLSVQPTVVKRLLERVDLRYDPRRPAPLETTLRMEDRVLIGAAGETVIEFLMLPKEER